MRSAIIGVGARKNREKKKGPPASDQTAGNPERPPRKVAAKEMIALLSTDIKFDSKPYIEVTDGAERLFNEEFKKYGFWASPGSARRCPRASR